jgi:hypothetical protein
VRGINVIRAPSQTPERVISAIASILFDEKSCLAIRRLVRNALQGDLSAAAIQVELCN